MNTAEYLKSEIVRIRKQTRTANVVGILLSCVVLIYAALGVWYVSVLTNPESLTNFVLMRFSQEAPRVIARAEMQLQGSAPEVADDLSKALQRAIPDLRIRAQAAVNSIVDRRMKELEVSAIRMSDGYFEAHGRDFAPRAKGENVDAYAARVANVLADQLGRDVDEQLKSSLGRGLDEINRNSGVILAASQKHMDALAATEFSRLSREDQLERILIAHVINQYLAKNFSPTR
jgi:hypothetical protein